jgi:hypothetical protein
MRLLSPVKLRVACIWALRFWARCSYPPNGGFAQWGKGRESRWPDGGHRFAGPCQNPRRALMIAERQRGKRCHRVQKCVYRGCEWMSRCGPIFSLAVMLHLIGRSRMNSPRHRYPCDLDYIEREDAEAYLLRTLCDFVNPAILGTKNRKFESKSRHDASQHPSFYCGCAATLWRRFGSSGAVNRTATDRFTRA